MTEDFNKLESKNDKLDFSDLICQVNNIRDLIPIQTDEIVITTIEQEAFSKDHEIPVIFEKTLNIVKQYIIKKEITLRACFEEFDEDQNNFIEKNEFINKILSIAEGQITEQEIQKIIPLLNYDQSGKIDFQEFSRFLRRYFKKNPLLNNQAIYIKVNKQTIAKNLIEEAIQKSKSVQNLTKQIQEQENKEQYFQLFLEDFQKYTKKNRNDELENLVEKMKNQFLPEKKDTNLVQKALVKLVKDLNLAFRKPENKIYLLRILLKLVNQIEKENNKILLAKVQQTLAECGVANMSLEIISLSNDESLCFEAISLLIILLKNGNKSVQEILLQNFRQTKHSQFFSFAKQYLRVFNDNLNLQQEILQLRTDKQLLKQQGNQIYLNVSQNYQEKGDQQSKLANEQEAQANKARQVKKILMLLQLLSENCFQEFQDFLRDQEGEHSIDLISESLSFLINLQYIDIYKIFNQEQTNKVYEQCLDALIDCTTGPCAKNQQIIGLRIKFYNLTNSITSKFNSLLLQLCDFYDQTYNKKNLNQKQCSCLRCFKQSNKVFPLSQSHFKNSLQKLFQCCTCSYNGAEEQDFKNDKVVQTLQRNLL